MDTYNIFASWIGWPPIVALLLILGGFGVWFYQKHNNFLQDEIAAFERKLQDCLNLTPDVVAKRLAERAKLLQTEIEILLQDREQHESKIVNLQTELDETQNEAKEMRSQLSKVEDILLQLEEPRDGKFLPSVENEILKTVQQQSAIFIPIESLWSKTGLELASIARNNGPYKLEVNFPGMMKMYLLIYNSKNELIGKVANPYFEVYYKDYLVTLLDILAKVPNEKLLEGIEYPPSGQIILLSSEFHSLSPIDPDIIYIKVNCNDYMFALG